MTKPEDPRLAATRAHALDAALDILRQDGVLAVTHGAISAATGISRSTLYRHWPKLAQLRNDAFKRAASPAKVAPRTDGPLDADLKWLLSILLSALNDTPWGDVAPQVVAVAATDDDARAVINGFMSDRIASVQAVFDAANDRGELRDDAPSRQLIETAIAVPYFRKLIAGLPLDDEWLDTHVRMICDAAVAGRDKPGR